MTTERMLANAAFGDDPGRWPLPQATTTHELWLRAVVAGGQGRYASALADLAAVCRRHRGGPLISLAHSTHASFLRQLGWHTLARGWDGRALALAGRDGTGAVGHAQRAVDLAAECGSTRHALKSDVVLAAALCSAGKVESARQTADPALETAGRLGMLPLRWALACLLADIGSGAWSAAQVAAIRDAAADTVRRLGGAWSAR